MINSNHVSTCIEKGAITTDDSASLLADVPYREAVDSLIGIPGYCHQTRHSICSGSAFSGFGATLESYSDSDYAGDPLTRRSTSGMVFKYNGGAIAWRSQ
ncbi:hypothetical protein TNIN_438051 [Trichonephila inaurata madagascariensis]|uniref:Uncharacterized protein n=1 Tax=Trichonephila inaurata madagascariensis TaxID=2747483 RepID=A0A8X7BPI6_9ARAC|nr:hypothetical protein TNIN_438051 [Trichonephila inaurata madagascariensis]